MALTKEQEQRITSDSYEDTQALIDRIQQIVVSYVENGNSNSLTRKMRVMVSGRVISALPFTHANTLLNYMRGLERKINGIQDSES